MGGIYGNMLPAFAEQYKTYYYFDMSPMIDDGYTNITSVSSIHAILRLYSAPPTAEGQKVRMAEGNLVTQKAPFLWYERPLGLGKFIADKKVISGGTITGTGINVYRIMTNNLFDDTSDLVIHGLNKLVGANGMTASSLSFAYGTGNF